MAAIALLCDVDYLHKEITTCCGYRVSINYDLDFMLCIVLLSASYILGLINNWINDCVFCGFRNNLYAIENELMRALSDNENIYLKRYGISWPGLTKPHVKSRCEESRWFPKIFGNIYLKRSTMKTITSTISSIMPSVSEIFLEVSP